MESLAEVSGAVEIEVETLNKIEQGMTRPSEDILLLLISHFGVKEDEATRLWELASYDRQPLGSLDPDAGPSLLVAPADARITYTDMTHTVVNDYGVVINFMQSNGPNGQPMIVSRLGMSREHAQSMLEILKKTLQAAEPKSLPAPGKQRDKQREN